MIYTFKRSTWLLYVLFSCISLSMGAGSPFFGKQPEMSPEEIKLIEEKLNKMSPEEQGEFFADLQRTLAEEIDKAVAQMPEAEQKKFFRAVERLSEIPKDQLEDILTDPAKAELLFTELLSDESDLSTIPQPPIAPQESSPLDIFTQEEITVVAPPTPIINSEQETIALLIKEIVARINEFTSKVSGIPELPIKIEGWIKKNVVPLWNSSWNWSLVQQDIEKLQQQLALILTQDDKKNYPYIAQVMQNEPLMQTLKQLHTTLQSCVPVIQPCQLTIESTTAKLSKGSKQALQNIIGTFGSVFNNQGLLTSLTAVTQKKINTPANTKESPTPLTTAQATPPPAMTSAGKEDADNMWFFNEPIPYGEYHAPTSFKSPSYSQPASTKNMSGFPAVSKQAKPIETKKDSTPKKPSSPIKKPATKPEKKSEIPTDILLTVRDITAYINDAAEMLSIDMKGIDPAVVEFNLKQAAKKLTGKTKSAAEELKILKFKLSQASKEVKEKALKEVHKAFAAHEQLFNSFSEQPSKRIMKSPSAIDLQEAIQTLSNAIEKF